MKGYSIDEYQAKKQKERDDFFAKLDKQPPAGCSFKLGDVVTYTNENSVVCPGKVIGGFRVVNGKTKVFWGDKEDVYWCGYDLDSIKPEPKPLYAFYETCKHVDWFTEKRTSIASRIDKTDFVEMIGGQSVWNDFMEPLYLSDWQITGLFKSKVCEVSHRHMPPYRDCVYGVIKRTNEEGYEEERQVMHVIFAVGDAWVNKV